MYHHFYKDFLHNNHIHSRVQQYLGGNSLARSYQVYKYIYIDCWCLKYILFLVQYRELHRNKAVDSSDQMYLAGNRMVQLFLLDNSSHIYYLHRLYKFLVLDK